ncbi:MAG: hypothetical protein GY829_09035, partial [Gammaproteobacteria bacterium]|nr:hypothetical protein [Gammaproteobacteria bacterium]
MEWVTVLLILIFLQACTSKKPLNNNDLENLLENYRIENEKMKTRRIEALRRGINRLDIAPPDIAGGPVKISVDLKGARLDVVVKQILDDTKTEYINNDHNLRGTVTARFENRPLVEALSILLNQHGMKASRSDSMIILEHDKSLDKVNQVMSTLSDDNENVHVSWPLEKIKMSRAIDVLTNLYPKNPDDDTRVLNFAAQEENNS